MAPRNRRLFVLAIAITLFVGVMTSFGLPLFVPTPEITLPSTPDESESSQNPGAFDPNGPFVPVTVTTDTVQAVVSSLERAEQYHRSITIERWGSRESADPSSIQVWKYGQLERVYALLPDGSAQNRLTDGSTLYLWHSGERRYHSYPAGQKEIDLSEEIPTYELVAELNPDRITAAAYDVKLEKNCIYVAYESNIPGWTQRFWVSTETGLLIAAEHEDADGQIKYRMAETSYNTDEDSILSQNRFVLPDGTRLD